MCQLALSGGHTGWGFCRGEGGGGKGVQGVARQAKEVRRLVFPDELSWSSSGEGHVHILCPQTVRNRIFPPGMPPQHPWFQPLCGMVLRPARRSQ